MAGYSRGPGGDDDTVIWRYNDDGTLDTSFNGQGWVVHDNAAGAGDDDRGLALTMDSTGRILVAGYSRGPGFDHDMVIWKYNDDGSLDVTFNVQGWVVHDSAAGGANQDQGLAITLDALGRILGTGFSRNPAGDDDMVIWRYE